MQIFQLKNVLELMGRPHIMFGMYYKMTTLTLYIIIYLTMQLTYNLKLNLDFP